MAADAADLAPGPRNLADLVGRAARRDPDKTALVAATERISWAELEARVAATAGGLAARLAPGERVLLALGNVPEFVVGYFATLRAGLVAVPANTGYPAAELAHLLADSGARLVLAGRPTEAAVRAAAEQAAGGPAAASGAGGGAPRAAEVLVADAGELPAGRPTATALGGAEDLAVLLYTAGTTGRPKGAMLSHRALLANLAQLQRVQPPAATSHDVVLLVLPLFHVYGLNAALGLAVAVGATGVLVDRFDPVETLATIRAEGVTNVVGAPPMFIAWSMLPGAREAFTGVRVAVSGAAPLPRSAFEALRDAGGPPVREGYGLTESAPVLTTAMLSPAVKAGSVGRPLPGVELRLRAPDGGPADEGDPGEIVVRGANLFSGYWPDGADGPDRDGWYATGDIGYLDDDGDLFLVGRRKELILVSGFNVYPREVEQVLARHPDVAEVAVVGLPHPYTGETVKAFVVPAPGAAPDPRGLVEFAARSLARFKCPTAVEFVDALPYAAAGKVARSRLTAAGEPRAGRPGRDEPVAGEPAAGERAGGEPAGGAG